MIHQPPPPPASPDSDYVAYRGTNNDPNFGFLIALALALGLTALPAGNADFRYTVSWLALTIFAVLAWLFGSSARIARENLENIVWGVAFGFIVGLPLLAFGSDVLSSAVKLIFPDMKIGTLLAYLIFVMPLAETLFFRGVFQENRSWWVTGLLSTFWSLVLLFPTMWADLMQSPVVGVVITTTLLMINLMYSYVRQRNGLAAAWICQIVVNIVLVFIPALSA